VSPKEKEYREWRKKLQGLDETLKLMDQAERNKLDLEEEGLL